MATRLARRDRWRTRPLLGAVNGMNTVFQTPEPFIHLAEKTVAVMYNGQRLFIGDDFQVAESGGPGTGYDTILLLFTPRTGDRLDADYFAK